MLSDLNSPRSLIIYTTNSSLAEMFVYDTIKAKAKANKNTIIDVKDKKSFENMLEMILFEPMMVDKWIFNIYYKGVRSQFEKLKKNLQLCETAYFLVNCEKYADFKKAVTGVSCTELYLNSLKHSDIYTLFSTYLSADLQRHLANNYSAEKCFELYNYFIDGGKPLENKKALEGVIGLGESSVKDLILDLVKDYKGTERSTKIHIRKRINDLSYLITVYQPRSLQNFLVSEVKNMLEIKQLYLMGILYNDIDKERLPESSDYSKLSRYRWVFDKIKTTPVQRFVYLLQCLHSGVWSSESDVALFLYSYFSGREDYSKF